MTNDQLMVEVANLRAENRRLRKQLPALRGDMGRLAQAHRDAKAMLIRRFSGYSISRAECESAGIPRRRWPWAIALLRCAGIFSHSDVVIDEFGDAVAMLDREYQGMERSRTIIRLKSLVPPSSL